MRIPALLLAVWLLAGPSGALAADVRTVGLAEEGSEIELAVGESILVSLPLLDARPPRIVEPPDPGVLRPDPAGSVPALEEDRGVWRLVAVAPGRTTIGLELPAVGDIYRIAVLVPGGGIVVGDPAGAPPAGFDPLIALLAGLLLVGGIVGLWLLRAPGERPRGLLGGGDGDDAGEPPA